MALALDRYPDITYDMTPPEIDDLDELRLLRKWEVAIGYRIFARMRWGQLGDGHITARDPILTDHFWVLGYGIPFWAATIHNLTLIGPDGSGVMGPTENGINHAGYCIHHPILDTHPHLASAAHTHTGFGTPWSANVQPFRAISQESCALVFDQALYEGQDLEVLTTDGGYRIAEALGTNKVCILRNHGLLTGGHSPAEAVGWFVMAERVAEVHVKAPDAPAISDEAAKEVEATLGPWHVGWRQFQWLARDLVPDPSVVL
ncbi:MAG: class II aldolase/adducin family protein [Acidimicrobiales bacterium]|nr:class II aldolase/adducin family protein [Acidimicrobiales bacterium]